MNKFEKPGIRYKAKDYLEYKEERKLSKEAKATITYIVCAILLVITTLVGPTLVNILSKQIEVLAHPSVTGEVVLIILVLLYILTMKDKLGIKQEGVYLLSDTIKSITIAVPVYFIAAIIWTKARFWTEVGYWAICVLFGLFGSIFAIGLIASWSKKKRGGKNGSN